MRISISCQQFIRSLTSKNQKIHRIHDLNVDTKAEKLNILYNQRQLSINSSSKCIVKVGTNLLRE